MTGTSPENVYLEQVLEQQARVDRELRKVQAPGRPSAASQQQPLAARAASRAADKAEVARAIDYRVTGWWIWQTVVVPPNVYVVHTRRGRSEPVTIGLGISFRFNPYRDAFLLIPAATQTIIINARCICTDRQGILVQAYVQWIIDDIKTAYRKLDFSDPEDPMRIVNVQLREQAEAAIKDKVATMGIDEVLSDKQPIIAELTHRLREVAEGSRQEHDAGLGLKIVTVQIKEAVVSSTRLWENLQKPFRAEREKIARMAELESQQQIAARELEYRQTRETAQLEMESRLSQLRAGKDQEVYDRDQAEKARRHQMEQQAQQRELLERAETEKVRKQAALDLALSDLELEARRIDAAIEGVRRDMKLDEAAAERKRGQAAADLEVDELRSQAEAVRSERDLAIRRSRQQIENDLSASHLQAQLIARLPEIAQALPQPEELRAVTITTGANGSPITLGGFLASLLHMAQHVLERPENHEAEKTTP
jgi:hypothetical protein